MDKTITYIIAIIAVISLIVASYGLATFQGQINDLNDSNTALETSLSGIQGTLTDIQDQIDDYQETITEQQQQIEEYKPVTLVDSMGNVVTLTEAPERIVSLSPSNTEILFAIGAGDKVVGITDYCDYPYDFAAWVEAGNITSIGSFWQPSTEPIIDLDPDLVFASTASLAAAENLQSLGYKVLVTEAKTIDGVLQDVLLIGRATDKNTEASALVGEMRARLDAVISQAASATTTPTVYHEVWNEPLQSVGPGTFIDEMITMAGGENIFSDATTSWPQISSESVIDRDPDVMFFPDMYMGVGNFYETIESVEDRPGWDSITAVKTGALYEIDADIISRSGPRVVDALEDIAKMVHPEIFGQP